jgi:hypothetical protein
MKSMLKRAWQARKLSPHELAGKLCAKLISHVGERRARHEDRRRLTYRLAVQGKLRPLLSLPLEPHPHPEWACLPERCAHYLAHRFDLLGSGWIEIRHGMRCPGLEQTGYPAVAVEPDRAGQWLATRVTPVNLPAALRAWRCIEGDYQPIDWHIDFKSGYRWRETTWYRDIKVGPATGVDIKLPWELARMQHLAALAQAYGLAATRQPGFLEAEIYLAEFRNQLLDFIATNPPRFGVNWACAMDVGIRIVNWLLARELFKQAGAVLDDEFEAIFAASVLDHASFIVDNLEWHPRWRGNHYLADLTGLLFAAAALPDGEESAAWLSFAAQQMLEETDFQFHAEGSSFEASTAYHRLSAELVIYSTALLVGLDKANRIPTQAAPGKFGKLPFAIVARNAGPLIPSAHWTRLHGMGCFSMDISCPDGQAMQAGDNDSGRLFKLLPCCEVVPWEVARRSWSNLARPEKPDHGACVVERSRDQRHLLGALSALLPTAFDCPAGYEHERALLAALAGGSKAPPAALASSAAAVRYRVESSAAIREHENFRRYDFAAPGTADLTSGLRLCAWSQFGLYLFKSPRLFLSVRCGQVGLNGLGAHAHNDALSIELWIDGQPLLRDPGTYLYTPLPDRRNAYRSVQAHFAPALAGREPADLSVNLFALSESAQPRCEGFDHSGFIGSCMVAPGQRAWRQIQISDPGITVLDWAEDPQVSLVDLARQPPLPYSDGYGWIAAPLP